MFTKIVTALALLPFTFISPVNALACDEVNGYTWCIQSNGNNRYSVTLQRGNETETFDIQCVGKRLAHWESYGPMSESQADQFARLFCSL